VTPYVAFLRAINVAGHGRVTMEDLRDAFTAAGCENVQSYIQSGNILFQAPAAGSAKLVKAVCGKLRDVLGEEPQIFLRTVTDMEEVIKQDPFRAVRAAAEVKLYVAFLAGRPRRKPMFPLLWEKEALEAIGMSGREVFVVSRRKPNGFFGFPNALVEAELGTLATSRNWSTVTKIVRLAASQAEG
jgi:uncharacterized protein (DUF1697 family)